MGEKSRGNFALSQKITEEQYNNIFKKEVPKQKEVVYELTMCVEETCVENSCNKKSSTCPINIKKV